MGIVMSGLRYASMKDFKDSFEDINYYMFASSLTDDDISVNTNSSSRLFLEKTIFGKKINPADVLFMIRRINWQTGVIYTAYDDEVDLSSEDFYVISQPEDPASDYYVFKCLSNNNGAVSTEKPVFSNDIISQNYVLRTADGYMWKYMYTVTGDAVQFYSTNTLFPVVVDQDVKEAAVQGIDHIKVVNPTTNFGYESQAGTIFSLKSGNTTEGYKTIYLDSANFNVIRGYYEGYTFYTTSVDGLTSRKYTIADSGMGANDLRPYVSVIGYNNNDITNETTSTWTFNITPSVEITGDGEGASALSVVENGRITKITVINPGEGYTRAKVRISNPSFGFDPNNPLSGDIECSLRAIISPKGFYGSNGGHGSDPALELYSTSTIVTSQFDVDDGAVIPTSNFYSKVGLIRNPSFTANTDLLDNRIRIELDSVDLLNVGEVVTQPTTNFYGVIHQIDSINSTIYVTEYNGPYSQSSFYFSNNVVLDNNQPLTTTAGRIVIVEVEYPPYEKGTGELLYVSDFESIERTDTLTEQFKFIITF